MSTTHVQAKSHCSIYGALQTCMKDIKTRAQARVRTGRPREPDYVAQIVFDLTDTVNQLIAPVFLPRLKLAAKGVFVHQSPLVRSTEFPDVAPASVEIGDLLLVISHHQQGIIHRWALLLQAKIPRCIHSRPNNRNQHYLYCHWPPFLYERGELSGKHRHVTGPQLYTGAQYLLMDVGHGACCPRFVIAHPTSPQLARHVPAAVRIFDMIFGNAGRCFTYPPPCRDIGWSRVIADLLCVTARRISRTMRSTPRGRGTMFFVSGMPDILGVPAMPATEGYMMSDSADIPPLPAEVDDTPDDGEGISLIEISLNEDEMPYNDRD